MSGSENNLPVAISDDVHAPVCTRLAELSDEQIVFIAANEERGPQSCLGAAVIIGTAMALTILALNGAVPLVFAPSAILIPIFYFWAMSWERRRVASEIGIHPTLYGEMKLAMMSGKDDWQENFGLLQNEFHKGNAQLDALLKRYDELEEIAQRIKNGAGTSEEKKEFKRSYFREMEMIRMQVSSSDWSEGAEAGSDLNTAQKLKVIILKKARDAARSQTGDQIKPAAGV